VAIFVQIKLSDVASSCSTNGAADEHERTLSVCLSLSETRTRTALSETHFIITQRARSTLARAQERSLASSEPEGAQPCSSSRSLPCQLGTFVSGPSSLVRCTGNVCDAASIFPILMSVDAEPFFIFHG